MTLHSSGVPAGGGFAWVNRPTAGATGEQGVNMEDGIVESVRGRLRSSAYSALKEIVCVGRGGAIELEGGVSSHYLKQVAQALVERVEGVTSIVNRIEVTNGRHL